MPSQHDANFAAAAAPVLLELHGEDVSYVAKGQAARTIKAIVRREPPKRLARGPAPRMTVDVLDHATDGIPLATLNSGADYLQLEYMPGQGTEKFYLQQKPKAVRGGLMRFEIA